MAEQFSDMVTNVRLKLEDVLEGEDMGDDLALPRVISTITGVEEASVDRHERVVEVALQASVSVGVDDLEGVWVGD